MMNEKNRSDFVKKVEQSLKKSGAQDSTFNHALAFHLKKLKYSKFENDIESEDEVCNYLLSKLFLDKMDLYPNDPFECQLDENSDWPLPPLSSELFGDEKQTDADRILWFYGCLKNGDVLDCRVSEVLQSSYQLRVIHKYGITRLYDDLQIMVVLQRNKHEMAVLEKELLKCELVRVVVRAIDTSTDIPIVHVTVVSEDIASFRPIPRLGRITKDEVPSYVFDPPDTEKFPTYSDYLNSKLQLQNPHYYNDLFVGCGIDPKTICSYFPEYNRKVCSERQTGQAFLKESKLDDAKRLAERALKSLERKKYDESFKSIKMALDICPEKDSLMSRLHDIRATIFSEQAKTGIVLKSFCDLELAFKMSTKDDEIRKKFIHRIFKYANAQYKDKQYKSAAFGYQTVLKYDGKHKGAATALEHINTRHADKLLNLEETSLIDLQDKKKELLSELKKINKE